MRPLISILSFVFLASCSDKTQRSKPEPSFKAFPQKSRFVDTSFVKMVKLNHITVCSSTISDLKQLGYIPVLTPKQEIDSLITAVNWQEGDYYLDKTRNLLFCTYENSDLLSSIFLMSNFGGTIRELPISDFSKLTVREITTYFKDLHWSITGVSDYWIYGNDTVNFYIKVDKSIPRFPLNQKFYEDKHPVMCKIQFLCSRIYGDQYAKDDTVMQKPLYAPFSDTHLNYYLLRRKPGIGTTIKEITSTGKKTVMEEIRIGRWVTYSPEHTVRSVKYYNDGNEVDSVEK